MINQIVHIISKHTDSILMSCILFAMLVGLFVLYSASGESLNRLTSQLINISVAITIMWAVANIQPQLMERIALPLYLIGLLLLLGVALFGNISHGARRWLDLGGNENSAIGTNADCGTHDAGLVFL